MMMFSIPQTEYVTYMEYVEEIKVIEQCCRKNQLERIGFIDNHFVKIGCSELTTPTKQMHSLFDKLSPTELQKLKGRVEFINTIHRKFEQGTRTSDDCSPLVMKFYTMRLKTIAAWNGIFEQGELHIDMLNSQTVSLNSSCSDKTAEQMADEKALTRYFELLDRHPKLKREGDLNDYTQGTYQIVYDPQQIQTIRQECYERVYKKSQEQGLSDSQAHDLAISYSRPGVVFEDQFWLVIRDVVISPQGYKHTYDRHVWKCDLDRIGGAVALPILSDGTNKKIVLQLAFRHATNSWEMEIPRGGSKPNETSLDTARREIQEETGYVTPHLTALGAVTPDSGLTASVVPVFAGEVSIEKETQHDKTEAIKGKCALTVEEVEELLERGYKDIEINNKIIRAYVRDPFLVYALHRAQSAKLLPLPQEKISSEIVIPTFSDKASEQVVDEKETQHDKTRDAKEKRILNRSEVAAALDLREELLFG